MSVRQGCEVGIQGVEVFGWSRIPKYNRSQSRIKNPTPTLEISMNHFLHPTPKLGILTHAC